MIIPVFILSLNEGLQRGFLASLAHLAQSGGPQRPETQAWARPQAPGDLTGETRLLPLED